MVSIIPTIDVEGVHGYRPFEDFILGETDSGDFGTLKIAEVFHKYGVQGTFFLDVYEYVLWGKDKFERLCHDLLKLDQDIQLHTHPSWRDDPRDPKELRELKKKKFYFPPHLDFMAKLSLEQQIEVLERGKELLVAWTGNEPVAHRSGGYSINQDTIRALKAVGIRVDSSMHYNHPNSKLTWSKNKIVNREGVIELPVTIYENHFIYKGLYSKQFQTNLETCTFEDFVWFANECATNGLQIVNYFMHSYSLLSMNTTMTKFRGSAERVNLLDRSMKYFSEHPDYEVISAKQMHDKFIEGEFRITDVDFVPSVPDEWKIGRMAIQKLGRRLGL